jgi:serine/threonine protein kinase
MRPSPRPEQEQAGDFDVVVSYRSPVDAPFANKLSTNLVKMAVGSGEDKRKLRVRLLPVMTGENSQDSKVTSAPKEHVCIFVPLVSVKALQATPQRSAPDADSNAPDLLMLQWALALEQQKQQQEVSAGKEPLTVLPVLLNHEESIASSICDATAAVSDSVLSKKLLEAGLHRSKAPKTQRTMNALVTKMLAQDNIDTTTITNGDADSKSSAVLEAEVALQIMNMVQQRQITSGNNNHSDSSTPSSGMQTSFEAESLVADEGVQQQGKPSRPRVARDLSLVPHLSSQETPRLRYLRKQRAFIAQQIEREVELIMRTPEERSAVLIQRQTRRVQAREVLHTRMLQRMGEEREKIKAHVPLVAKGYVQHCVAKALNTVGEIMIDMPVLQIQHYGVPQYDLNETAVDEGTFGQVCMGLHKRTNEMVAVKLVEKRRLKDYVDLKRLVREVRSAKRVRHQNVVQMFEVVDGKHHVQIVMEMIDGGKLFDYIVQKSRLPEVEACFLFRQILDGLQHIHSMGVSHRDLKPENIMLQSSSVLPLSGWRIKIIDFDLSNTMTEDTHGFGTGAKKKLKTACGSPHYAAPEVVAGEAYYGDASDVWALGVILFAMICGYLPFEHSNIGVLYEKIMCADYQAPSSISKQAEDLIRKIFNTNAGARIDIDGIRKHRWTANPKVPAIKAIERVADEKIQEQILIAMEKMPVIHLNRTQILAKIKAKEHDNITTTYYLLLKRFQRMEEEAWLDSHEYAQAQVQPQSDEEEDEDDEPASPRKRGGSM